MHALSHLKLRTKLALLLGLAVLAVLTSIGIGASTLHRRMIVDRTDKLRVLVEVAHSIAQTLEGDVKAGGLTREQALDRFRALIYGIRYDGDEYLMAYASDGIIIAHGADRAMQGANRNSLVDVDGHAIVPDMIGVARQGEGTTTYSYPRSKGGDPLPKLTYVKAYTPWNMFVATGAYIDDLDSDFRTALWRLGTIGALILLVTLGAAWLINRDITGSLGRLKTAMARLATGDLAADIPGINRHDEVGEMAAAVQVFKNNGIEMDRLKAEQEAAGRQAAADKRLAMAGLANTFEADVGAIVSTVASAATEMETTASSMTATAEATSRRTMAVAAASEQASTNVQSVAGAAEELSSSVTEIGRQVASSSAYAAKAVSESERTNALVNGLADAAQKIGAVTSMISEIAGRTNLLALNATIEAARAGEAGKGFAVVASEVKSLATQTAKATGEISMQIAAMQSATDDTVAAIRSIGATISQISEIAATIAAAVEEQGAATQEIARNVQQAAAGTTEVSGNIAGVTQAVGETGTAANQVLTAAVDLTKQATTLRGHVDRFLIAVRAA
jgi:methyl-accepting chemotaxis protein